jgi:hypothetical protein
MSGGFQYYRPFIKLALKLNRAEPFLESQQCLNHSRIYHYFMENDGSLPCQQEPATDLSPKRD